MSNAATALGIGADPLGEVHSDGLCRPELRSLLGSTIGRQLQLQIAIEQSANPNNQGTTDPRSAPSGVGKPPPPILTYDLDQRVRDGIFVGQQVSVGFVACAGGRPW